MKRIGVCYLLFVLPFFIFGGEIEDIHDAAKRANSGDKAALQKLYSLSLSTNNKEIKPLAIRAVTLTMLKTGSKSLINYVKTIQNLKNSNRLLFFIESTPIKKDCNSCKKNGHTLIDCRRCKTGDCLKCEGLGSISIGSGKNKRMSECRSCKASGFCGSCKGAEKTAVKCRICKGKGSIYDKSKYATEEKRAYKVLIHKSAELSKEISFKVDKKLLAEDKKKTAESEKWLAENKKRIEEFLKKEKERIAKATGNSNYQPLMTSKGSVEEDFENGKSTERLNQLCKEVNAYIEGQQRKEKIPLLKKVYGKYQNDLPTVHIILKPGFTKQSKDWRQRTGQGFYQFSKLRGQVAGYEKIGFILLDQSGKVLGKVNL